MKNILLIAIGTILIACQSETDSLAFEPTPFFECHDEQNNTKSEMAEAMVGVWNWQYISCYWNPEDANSIDCNSCTVEFKSDGQYEFSVDGEVANTGEWALLESFSAGFYNIQTDPSIEWILGQVYICEDQMLFFNSYIDGCDNYYKSED